MQMGNQQLPQTKIEMGSIRLYPGQFKDPANIGKLARSLGDFLGDKKKIPHENIYLTPLPPTNSANHTSFNIFTVEEQKPLQAARPQILRKSEYN